MAAATDTKLAAVGSNMSARKDAVGLRRAEVDATGGRPRSRMLSNIDDDRDDLLYVEGKVEVDGNVDIFTWSDSLVASAKFWSRRKTCERPTHGWDRAMTQVFEDILAEVCAKVERERRVVGEVW